MPVITLYFRVKGRIPPGSGAGVVVPCPDVDACADAIASVATNCHAVGDTSLNVGHFAAELRSRPGRIVTVWLAYAAETPVGLVAHVEGDAGPSPRHSIAWLLVGASARRRGVGSALVAAALDHARARGAAEVWVETSSAWPDVLAFWQAVGFTTPPTRTP